MSESIKEKNSNKKNKILKNNCINISLIKKIQKNREKKQKNENNNIKAASSKISLIDKDLFISFDKISKTLDKSTLQSAVHKIKNLVDFSKLKKSKIKIKNNFFTNISNIILPYQESKINNDFYKNRGCVTSREHLRKIRSTIDKDNSYKENKSPCLTQKEISNKIYKRKIQDYKKEKHISFHKINKDKNLYFSLIENGPKKKNERHNIKHINTKSKISYTGKNNHLKTEGSSMTKKDFKERYPLSNKKESDILRDNSSNNKESKNPSKIKKNKAIVLSNSICYNVYNNVLNKNEIKNENKNQKKNDIKNSFINHIQKDNKNQNMPAKQKTLVLDLDETLIYTSFEPSSDTDICIELDLNINEQLINQLKNNRLNSLKKNCKTLTKAYLSKRPYLDTFLSQLNSYYEICIYSASSEKYASSIIDVIDPNNILSKKFFRDDCIYLDNSETFSYIKDLEKLNKNYKDVIMIDDNASSFILQNENGIPIKSWRGDQQDIELLKLIPILKNLSGFYDVRTEIKQFVINKTFIWFQGIKWLCSNCLSYSYIREMINVMKMDNIPITNKMLCFFMEEEGNTNNINNSINIVNSTNFSNQRIFLNNKGSNSFINNNGKPRLIRKKIKKGKSANFTEVNNHYGIIKSKINNNKHKLTKIEIINNFKHKNISSRSGSIIQKKEKEKERYNNKLIERIKNKKLKIKNITNINTDNNSNNDTINYKKTKKVSKHTCSTTII
jgi:RNA polymerase II subunit A small phosphatase-like protein